MTRTEQREQAFILVFESLFLQDEDLIDIYEDNIGQVSKYAKILYNGVLEKQSLIDEKIMPFSKNWKLSRLPKVTLTALRIAVYEIMYVDNVPDSVSINEAVELSKKFGSKEDASFVNGILGSFVRSKE